MGGREETVTRCQFKPYDETEQYYNSGRLPPPGYGAPTRRADASHGGTDGRAAG